MNRLRQAQTDFRKRILYRIPNYGPKLEIKHQKQAKRDVAIRKSEREIKIEEEKHSVLGKQVEEIKKRQKIRSILKTQDWWCEIETNPSKSKISAVRFYTEDPNWEQNTSTSPERRQWIKLNVEAIQHSEDFWAVANQKVANIQSDFKLAEIAE